MRVRGYAALADYGLIGDSRSAALVAADGSVDWACFGRFDAPASFAAILDHGRGGRWRLAPTAERAAARQCYRPDTGVLERIHETGGGSVRVTDAFSNSGALVRLCEGLSGRVDLESLFEPQSMYGRDPLTVERGTAGLHADGLTLTGQCEVCERFELRPLERRAFILDFEDGLRARLGDAERLLEEADERWRAWSDGCGYEGPYRAAVVRSAITLKLLSCARTGAIVAAPTTSLPERVGGDANWDYRYTWLRDAALTLFAWYALDRREEGDAFFDWICARVGDADELKVMYDIDGGSDHEEQQLPWLEGYRGSRPVRIGNAACRQTQLDVYGEVLECFRTACAWGRRDKLSLWPRFRALAEWVSAHWHEPDSGIWELRGEERHFVHSKLMAWVALDSAIHTAQANALEAPLARWRTAREAIRNWVLRHGWNRQLQAFRQAAGSEQIDAANVLVPLVGFLPGDHRVVRQNLDRTVAELGEDGLL